MEQKENETIREKDNKDENKEKPDLYAENNENEENDKNENENEISRSTIKNVYGEDYDQILRAFKRMEDKAKTYFKEVIEKLETKYEEFNSNI